MEIMSDAVVLDIKFGHFMKSVPEPGAIHAGQQIKINRKLPLLYSCPLFITR